MFIILLAIFRDRDLVQRLLDGDEVAYAQLIDLYHGPLLGLARSLVGNQATAEEVVQDTWIAVMQGLHRFEGRASLKTWIFRILTYQARKRARRDARMISWTDMFQPDEGPLVDPSRFLQNGHWAKPPQAWPGTPEDKVIQDDVLRCVQEGLEDMPEGQRAVVTLRDVQGWSAREVCDALGISSGNQRVLLHRARTRLRERIERHFAEAQATRQPA